jgi:hypothetical protein
MSEEHTHVVRVPPPKYTVVFCDWEWKQVLHHGYLDLVEKPTSYRTHQLILELMKGAPWLPKDVHACMLEGFWPGHHIVLKEAEILAHAKAAHEAGTVDKVESWDDPDEAEAAMGDR